MLCQICHVQEASVYLIETVDNTQTTFHICENCAQRRHVGEVLNRSALTLQQLLASVVSLGTALNPVAPTLVCPRCGLTYAQFRETGRLGCSQCYDVFYEALAPLLRQYHQAEEHRGRLDAAAPEAEESSEARGLKEKIKTAVAAEDYELAARLRDQMRLWDKNEGEA
jgi:protein arginine kinase activator